MSKYSKESIYENDEFQGINVFGKAYGKMLENDIHAPGSIDCLLYNNMVLLNKYTFTSFYPGNKDVGIDAKYNSFSKYIDQLKGKNKLHTLLNVFNDLYNRVKEYDVDFQDMIFGGVEQGILMRNTDWCTDISRVFLVLSKYIGFPARLVFLANLKKAYHGHVIVEVFYEERWGLFDVVNGIQYYESIPIGAYDVLCDKNLIKVCYNNVKKNANEDEVNQFLGIAISEYNIADVSIYDYSTSTSKKNDYYNKISEVGYLGKWLFDEDK